jgi:hypothetical protein
LAGHVITVAKLIREPLAITIEEETTFTTEGWKQK